MKRPAMIVALLALGACVSPREYGSEPARPMSRLWLTGGWVLEGEACESDAGVIYRPDGSWIADGASGTWKIKKGRLFTTIREQANDAGAMVRLDPPVRKSEPIESAEANRYRVRAGDGTVRQLKRCARGFGQP